MALRDHTLDDNIITDRVQLAKRTLKHKDSNAISDMVKYIFEQ